MRQQAGQLLGQKVAARVHHLGLRRAALGDVVHLLFQLGRHLGVRDVRGELVQRIAHGHAQLAGLDGVVHAVLHRIEALDDGMARGLRAQAQLLHLLDELALAVARGRLGLLLRADGAVERDGLALGKRGQLLVFLEAVGVDSAVARLHQNVALRHERLGVHVEGDLRALDDGRLGQRRQKAPRDEVVQLVVGGSQIVGRGLGGRVDGRVVRRLLLAARGRELALRQ